MRWDKVVESIEQALDKECYLPALALTLVIPDICAHFDYPQIYGKKEDYMGRQGKGAAYAKWYDENIRKYEIPDYEKCPLEKEIIEKYKELDEKSAITGLHCWRLRCRLLHNVSLDIDDIMSDDKYNVSFEFIVSEESPNGYGGSCRMDETSNHIFIRLNLVTFCKKILAVFKNKYLSDDAFIKSTDNKQLNFIEIK